jgi:phage-related protein
LFVGETMIRHAWPSRTVTATSGGVHGATTIGRPHCAPLGKGLWEVRSSLDSNRIARVIFCMGDGYMILLHGFIKKTQKTPQADIDLALKRKREVT